MNAVSIFNDVIGPVMRGPSSSHCAAALRIGRLARDLMDGEMSDVLVEFDRAGSLPTTHESQGSDMGLFGGLLGWETDDERLPDSAQALADAGIKLRIETVDAGDPHPNTYRLTLRNERETHYPYRHLHWRWDDRGPEHRRCDHDDGRRLPRDAALARQRRIVRGSRPMRWCIHDAGGFQLVQVKASAFVSGDGLNPMALRRLAPVLPVPSRKETRVPFTSCAEMLRHDWRSPHAAVATRRRV